jgi:hypothetical protein
MFLIYSRDKKQGTPLAVTALNRQHRRFRLTTPTQSRGIVSYGQLKLHLYWDPLRGDPRFDKIVASLAPKG